MVEGSSWGVGVIFAAKRKNFKACKRKVKNRPEEGVSTKHRKIGGELCHTVHTLKKVARLSSKDRRAVLKTLKKRASKRKMSVVSVTPQLLFYYFWLILICLVYFYMKMLIYVNISVLLFDIYFII